MKKSKTNNTTQVFEQKLKSLPKGKYVLRLYVTGVTTRSTRAIMNIREICEKYLKGSYQLEVVDIYQQPKLAKDEQIIAAPTLVKLFPLPLRKFVGDLSNTDRIVSGLDLRYADT